MKKILIHLSNENEYRSFVRALVKNASSDYQLIGNALHDVLFDTNHKIKPELVLLPSNEYTQEFHDYITEFHKTVKIILFTNNLVVNEKIIDFWNFTNTVVVSKKEWYPEKKPEKFISYDNLYDNEIYKNLEKPRNNKIAVYLSSDDQKNHDLLDKVLYPNSVAPLCLFNSISFKHSQNLGLLTPEDSCKILNTYRALIDIDNKFYLEATACGIDNLSTSGDIQNIIDNNICKKTIEEANSKSYSNFIQTALLPIL
jgi:hypothetical protein